MFELVQALKAGVESRIGEVHVAIPARIEKYDHATCKAEVLPLVRRILPNGDTLAWTIIPNVPVVWPRTSEFIFHAPLIRGDGVLLIFSERSIDDFLSAESGQEVTPTDPCMHSIRDAIAIPGLFPFTCDSKVDADDEVQIIYKDAKVRIKSNGDVSIDTAGTTKIGGDIGTKKLITEDLITLYNSHTHATAAPGPVSTPLPQLIAATITTQQLESK